MTKCPRCGGTMGKNYEQGLKDERKRILEIIDKTIKETTNLLEKVGMVKIKQQIKEKE